MSNIQIFLKPTYFIDSNSKVIKNLALDIAQKGFDSEEKAKKLFYWTRDEISYNPYESFSLKKEDYKASHIAKSKKGWCVQKACVLSALARSIGIPSRLHFADIRNHAVPDKLQKLMGTNLFIYHGYTELYIKGSWIKTTPAFNIELCKKLNLKVVDFDGKNDAVFPKETLDGRRFIEYIKDRGTSPDLPLKKVFKTIKSHYDIKIWLKIKKSMNN